VVWFPEDSDLVGRSSGTRLRATAYGNALEVPYRRARSSLALRPISAVVQQVARMAAKCKVKRSQAGAGTVLRRCLGALALRLSLRHNPLVNSVAVCAESLGHDRKGHSRRRGPMRPGVSILRCVLSARLCGGRNGSGMLAASGGWGSVRRQGAVGCRIIPHVMQRQCQQVGGGGK